MNGASLSIETVGRTWTGAPLPRTLRDFLTCISGFLLLDPEDVANLNIGVTWNFGIGTGLLILVSEYGAERASFKA
jgi:hypothetical protein